MNVTVLYSLMLKMNTDFTGKRVLLVKQEMYFFFFQWISLKILFILEVVCVYINKIFISLNKSDIMCINHYPLIELVDWVGIQQSNGLLPWMFNESKSCKGATQYEVQGPRIHFFVCFLGIKSNVRLSCIHITYPQMHYLYYTCCIGSSLYVQEV